MRDATFTCVTVQADTYWQWHWTSWMRLLGAAACLGECGMPQSHTWTSMLMHLLHPDATKQKQSSMPACNAYAPMNNLTYGSPQHACVASLNMRISQKQHAGMVPSFGCCAHASGCTHGICCRVQHDVASTTAYTRCTLMLHTYTANMHHRT